MQVIQQHNAHYGGLRLWAGGMGYRRQVNPVDGKLTARSRPARVAKPSSLSVDLIHLFPWLLPVCVPLKLGLAVCAFP